MAPTKMLKDLYASCMSCPNSPGKDCLSILKDDKQYHPRGFYFESPYFESPRKILVVANNPGGLAEREEEYYNNEKVLVNAHLEFMRTVEKRSAFHKILRERYLPEILKPPDNKIFSHSAFTNLVKCTNANKGMFSASNPTVKTCFDKWFRKELEYLEPKAILAVGRPTEEFLKKKSRIIGIPSRCIIYVKHPSRGGYGQKKEPMELQKIRRRLSECT